MTGWAKADTERQTLEGTAGENNQLKIICFLA